METMRKASAAVRQAEIDAAALLAAQRREPEELLAAQRRAAMHAGETQRRWLNDRPKRIRERVAKFDEDISNLDSAAERTEGELREARRLLSRTLENAQYVPRHRAVLEQKCAFLEDQLSLVGNARDTLIAARARAVADTPITLAEAHAFQEVNASVESMEERNLQQGQEFDRYWARQPRQYVVTMKLPRLPVLEMPGSTSIDDEEEQIEEADSRWNA
jgi:hypothetical protein